MNEKEKLVETRQELTIELERTLKALCDNYPRVSRVKKNENLTEDVFRIVLDAVLIDVLKQLQLDSNHMSIHEFHSKYVPNLPILYRCDFTCDEFKSIIDSSYLQDRDKQIAYKFFVEKKNSKNVYDEMLEIGDKKTVSNNLDNINDILLHQACIYNKVRY